MAENRYKAPVERGSAPDPVNIRRPFYVASVVGFLIGVGLASVIVPLIIETIT